jgi:glycine cleavage system H protein
MSDSLFFMMGQHKAIIPLDRMYSARHLWLQEQTPGVFRVGFTAWSVRMLQDVYFLEWTVDPGSTVREKQEIGEIESSKAVSAMFPPGPGVILEFNPALLNDPSGINADHYGQGWLYTFQPQGSLLTAQQYVDILEAGWENAQRTIKGQMNE